MFDCYSQLEINFMSNNILVVTGSPSFASNISIKGIIEAKYRQIIRQAPFYTDDNGTSFQDAINNLKVKAQNIECNIIFDIKYTTYTAKFDGETFLFGHLIATVGVYDESSIA